MSWGQDDEIGYGKPPRYTQFKKGRSGNPKGRPKGTGRRPNETAETEQHPATEHDDTVRRLNNRKIVVKVGGKPTKVPVFEAVAMKQQANALEGSVTAQREIMRAKERLDERDARRRLEAEKKAREAAVEEKEGALRRYHFLVKRQAEQRRIYQDAAEAGIDPVPRYPHPDDFVFEHEKQAATFIGPWDEEGAHHYLKLAKLRDFHLVRYVVLCRQRPKGSVFHRRLAALEMQAYNHMLPRRQRLGGEALSQMLDVLFVLPMAELRDWRSDLQFWLQLNPMPELDKQARKDIYKFVNKVMQPILKRQGFRSLAQLERHCEEGAVESTPAPRSDRS
jgi:hypothetical protein